MSDVASVDVVGRVGGWMDGWATWSVGGRADVGGVVGAATDVGGAERRIVTWRGERGWIDRGRVESGWSSRVSRVRTDDWVDRT